MQAVTAPYLQTAEVAGPSASPQELLRWVIDEGHVSTLFQPIVALRDASVLGFEALSRGPEGTRLHRADVLFAMAEGFGLGAELEETCHQLALMRFAQAGVEGLLFLNITPHVLLDKQFRTRLATSGVGCGMVADTRVVLELTEQTAPDNYPDFIARLATYREQDVRFAVDDVGAGYSGLRLICDVTPEYLKLDMSLIRDIHMDTPRQQAVRFMVDFARAMRITVIAEGIEQEEEMLSLVDLGVEYGQGFYFAKPRREPAPPDADVIARVRDRYRARQAERVHRVATTTVGESCRPMPPVSPDTLCHQVESAFNADPSLLGLPVVRDGVPVGLIMRESFFGRLGRQYGYSLFHSRPISHVMDQSPLTVGADEPLESVAQAAMARPHSRLYDHIIINDAGGYVGVMSVRDLLERITEQGIRNARHANPLTGLPGNVIIQREIESALFADRPFTVLYADIDHFKAYNDVYGFDHGDDVLRLTADTICQTFTPAAFSAPFVGHIGGDDFVVVLREALADAVIEGMLRTFDQRVHAQYSEQHRAAGYITTRDRQGQLATFPLCGLSIAAVSHENGPFASYHDVAKLASELKSAAKRTAGSCLVRDQRRLPTVNADA